MKAFPWGWLSLGLLVLDLLLFGLHLANQHLAHWLLRRLLAGPHPEQAQVFLDEARTLHLITPEQESAFIKGFGLENK